MLTPDELASLADMLYTIGREEALEVGLSPDHDQEGYDYAFKTALGLCDDGDQCAALTDEDREALQQLLQKQWHSV